MKSISLVYKIAITKDGLRELKSLSVSLVIFIFGQEPAVKL